MIIKPTMLKVQKGFTLIEVVVALLVLTLTMTGLVQAIGNGANNQRTIEERTLAQWVALNQVAAMQLEQTLAAVGSTNGSVEMAARQWWWQQEVAKTEDPTVNRIRVTVTRETGSEELAQVVGYLRVSP